MSAAVWFVAVFALLFVGRVFLATLVFLWVLPDTTECPICDAPTLRVQHRAWNVLFPRFRTSWCPECGWEGLLQLGSARAKPVERSDLPVAARR